MKYDTDTESEDTMRRLNNKSSNSKNKEVDLRNKLD